MSKRNTYLIGAAAVLVGVVMIAIAVAGLSGDGDEGQPAGSGVQPPAGDGSQSPPAAQRKSRPGQGARGAALMRQLARGKAASAPDFALQLIHEGSAPPQLRRPLERAVRDGALELDRLRGSPVVLHIWSFRCAPCRGDARLVETTWRRWGRRGIAFVGLSVDEPASAAAQYARQYRLTYPIVIDPRGEVARTYGATSLPETFFISAAGDVVGHVAGGPSVRQLELGSAAARTGRTFGSEQGGSREPLR